MCPFWAATGMGAGGGGGGGGGGGEIMDGGGGGGEDIEDWDIFLTSSGGGMGPVGMLPCSTAPTGMDAGLRILLGNEGLVLSKTGLRGEAESRMERESSWVESLRVGIGGGPALVLQVGLSTGEGNSVELTEVLEWRTEFLLGGGGGPVFFDFASTGGGGGTPPPDTGGGAGTGFFGFARTGGGGAPPLDTGGGGGGGGGGGAPKAGGDGGTDD